MNRNPLSWMFVLLVLSWSCGGVGPLAAAPAASQQVDEPATSTEVPAQSAQAEEQNAEGPVPAARPDELPAQPAAGTAGERPDAGESTAEEQPAAGAADQRQPAPGAPTDLSPSDRIAPPAESEPSPPAPPAALDSPTPAAATSPADPAGPGPKSPSSAPAGRVPSLFLQGEYAGSTCCFRTDEGWLHDYAGLQVVDKGDGQFAAVFYPGGLPGSGWYRLSKKHLTGARHADQVELEGDGLHVTIAGARATVQAADGQRLGALDRVLRYSATLGKSPPPGAIVLFDGSGTEQFRNGRINDQGYLDVGADVKPTFRDYILHVEFRLPYQPSDRSQGRGNSGIYLQSRYEVQILDSFGLEGAFNECGALYRLRAPEVNMCLPPKRWQTYDIAFRSPRFDAAGQKVENARITVMHNNILVQDNVEVTRKTGAGQPEGPKLLSIKLQNHGDPVVFRNIWIVDYSR